MIETCQQAMVHMADLETIISLCKNLAATARFLTKTQRLRTRGAEYQLQYVLVSTKRSIMIRMIEADFSCSVVAAESARSAAVEIRETEGHVLVVKLQEMSSVNF
jgi:hypothetical protein